MTRPNRRPSKAPPPVPRMRPGVPAAPKPAVPMSPELRRVLRGQLVEALLDQLSGDLASAARTLAFLSRSGGSEPTRLAAARALIELHSRLRSDVELEGRIQALEDDKAADQGDRP